MKEFKGHNRLSAFGVSGTRMFLTWFALILSHNRLSAFGVSGTRFWRRSLDSCLDGHNRLSAFGVSGTWRRGVWQNHHHQSHNRLSAFGVSGTAWEILREGGKYEVTIAFRLLG